VTVIRLLDDTKCYLHAVIDNFSRRILSWRLARRLTPATTCEILKEAGKNLDQTPTVVADSGVENVNAGVDQLMADGVVRRVLAQVEVSFRDRDKIYGADFVRRVRAMGIEQVLTSPRSPWQNPYCERVIGTLRRECLDHVIVLGEQHLRRILRRYLEYYHGSRTHLALGKDAPEPRERESTDEGKVIALPMVGGLHHRYTRRAA